MTVPDVPEAAHRPEPAAHPRADRAYVLGLLAVVGSVFVLPLLLGPYVWFLGVSARREMDREPDRWSGGRKQATAGLVLGAVATTLLALLVLALVGWAVAERLTLSADTGY